MNDTVSQDARDAAAALIYDIRLFKLDWVPARVEERQHDDSELVQAFATFEAKIRQKS